LGVWYRLAQLGTTTVDRLAQQGEIPGFKLSGTWRFRRTELDRWIAAQIVEKTQDKPERPAQRSPPGGVGRRGVRTPMNAVEIEQAISDLAEQPFDPAEFPYAFLEAFGNKAATIKRLRAGASNKSDLGGVLQTSNIHILTCDAGRVTQTLRVGGQRS